MSSTTQCYAGVVLGEEVGVSLAGVRQRNNKRPCSCLPLKKKKKTTRSSYCEFVGWALLQPESTRPPRKLSVKMSSQSEAGSMKDKITDLSMRINVQDEILDEQDKRIAGLEGGADDIVQDLNDRVGSLKETMSKQLAAFKDESEHKFSLQIAENKRLSKQMSTQKKENQRLIERIHKLEERVKQLELQIGD